MRISVLGSFAAEVGGAVVDAQRWRLRKAPALVAMLALEPGQRLHRDKVIDRLWPDLDPSAGARNLHQTLYVARRAIGHSGSNGLLTVRDEIVVLNGAGPVDVDAVAFEEQAELALAQDDDARLRTAADSYTGDLLPDLAYTDWVAARRVALRETYHAVLVRLASHHLSDGAFDEAQILLAKVLGADPLNEVAVRSLMGALAATGRRPEALARYERFRDDLLEASGADPDEQTRALFRELLTASPPEPPSPNRDTLPVALTSFVGRTRVLADVENLLARTRLVTLTGTGGCGKTRLAIESARRVAHTYRDGVWFVDLSSLSEAWLVPDAVATGLDLTPGAGDDQTKAVTDQLKDRAVLIVLDNCEHLLNACAHIVAALLTNCPKVRVLATSRETLRVAGEVTFRVPSLDLPTASHHEQLDLSQLAQLESVRLFTERAGRVRPGFELDPDNAHAVAELCRRLDGIPLALELAAARVNLLEPAEILARLGDALTALGRGFFGATRHQTLRAALAWSHDLLDSDEQALFRRLSVFAGSFPLAAVESVCVFAPLQRAELLDLLGRLVDKSLVLAEPSAGGTRYRLLETVRQFGADYLRLAGEVPTVAASHCAHYLRVAVRHDPENFRGVHQENPLLLDQDHDNFRAALGWALSADPAAALGLVTSLWRFWFLRGHAVEGSDWIERALATAPEPSLSRAHALVGLTGLDARRGRGRRLRSEGEEAVALAEQLGDPGTAILYRLVHATLVWATSDVQDAERAAAEVRTTARAAGRGDLLAGGTWLLGMCSLTRDDASGAERLLGECLTELDAADPDSRPFLPVITPCVLVVPIRDRLVPSFEESLLGGLRVGTRQAVGYVLNALGYAARLDGRFDTARSVVQESVDLFVHLGDDMGRAHSLNHLGCVLRDAHRFGEAAATLREARDIRRRLGDRRGELLTSSNLALVRALDGDIDQGRDQARACLAAFEAVEDHPALSGALGLLANIELVAGELRAARDYYARAVVAFETQSWPRIEGWHRLMVAELSAELGDRRVAGQEVERASALIERQRCELADGRVQELRRALARC